MSRESMKRSRPTPVFVNASTSRQRLVRATLFVNEAAFSQSPPAGWKKYLLAKIFGAATIAVAGQLTLDGLVLTLDGLTLGLT
jgi:hypothetical protein